MIHLRQAVLILPFHWANFQNKLGEIYLIEGRDPFGFGDCLWDIVDPLICSILATK